MSYQAYQHYPPMARGPMDGGMEAVLLARLRAQVEFYFSPQNLARDTFLRSMLDSSDGAVPVETIANFPKVRELYAMGRLPPAMAPPADPVLICRALEGSQVVKVSQDGKWISPISSDNVEHKPGNATTNESTSEGDSKKSPASPAPSSPSSQTTTASSAGVPTHPIQMKERTTVIVRDVPEDCTVDEIMEIFSSKTNFRPKSARHDVGNTWYVHFSTESQAVTAISATRDQTIRGKPIHAGIKSERTYSSTPSAPRPPPQAEGQQFVPQYQYVPPQYGYMFSGYPAYIDPYYGVPVIPQGGYPPVYASAMPPPPQQYPYYAHYPVAREAPPPGVAVQQSPHVGRQPGIPTGIPADPEASKSPGRKRSGKRNKNKSQAKKINEERLNGNYTKSTEYQHKPPSRDLESPPTSDGSSKRKGSYQRKKKNDRRRDGESTEMLSQANFPALVDCDKGKSVQGTKEAPKAAYAAALLKSRSVPPTTAHLPSGESTAQAHLEQGMSKLNISTNQNAAESTTQSSRSSS